MSKRKMWQDTENGRSVTCLAGDESAVIYRALDGSFCWYVYNTDLNGSCPSLASAKEEAEAAMAALGRLPATVRRNCG